MEDEKKVEVAKGIEVERIDALAIHIATEDCGPMPPEIERGEDVDGPWRDTYNGAVKMAHELVRLGYVQFNERLNQGNVSDADEYR